MNLFKKPVVEKVIAALPAIIRPKIKTSGYEIHFNNRSFFSVVLGNPHKLTINDETVELTTDELIEKITAIRDTAQHVLTDMEENNG